MTYEQFIKREMHVWGEDCVFDLFDRGYKVVLLVTDTGQTKWTWKMPVTHERGLTLASQSATLAGGSSGAFTPVFVTHRASRG